MNPARALTPVNVLTGFLGSGKTTLLQRLLGAPQLGRTAVLINEFGEIGLDHLLVQRVDEAVVLLESGCVVIETTGLADPGPILYTLLNEPVLQHHFRLGNVITTVDAVNAELHLSRNPEGIKQVAAADRLLVTKTDLAAPDQVAAVRQALAQVNPSAQVRDALEEPLDVDALLDVRPPQRTEHTGAGFAPLLREEASRDTLRALRRHSENVSSFSLVLDQPLDWTAFGVWLSLLLNRHGDDVLRVKGILQVQGSGAPVFLNAVQHVVHPPQHLDRWPTDDHRSRIVFITRGIDHARLRRSLEAFCGLRVAEVSVSA
jgi:G3E family GTPase